MILWAALAFAADPDALGLDDVLVAVETSHPLLDAARARAEGAAGDRLAAVGALDPVIAGKAAAKSREEGSHTVVDVGVAAPLTVWGGDVSVGWTRGVGEFEPYEKDAETEPGGEIYARVDLPLLRDAWTDRRRASVARATREVDVAEAERRARELEVLRTAAHRYWDWVGAGHRLDVAVDLLALAEARDRAFAAQVDLGDVAPILREDSRRLVIERTERVVAARRTFDQAAIELSLHLRDAEGRRVLAAFEAVPDSIPEVPPREDVAGALAIALEQRPELDRFDAWLAQAWIEERLASNQALPAIDLRGAASTPGTGAAELGIGVAAEWSIPARTARGRLESARAWEERLLAERAFAEDRVWADVADAASALAAGRARVDLAEELARTAATVAEAERTRFDLGDSNLIFVNQREIAQAEAEVLRIDALVATQKAWIDWRWAQADLGASPTR